MLKRSSGLYKLTGLVYKMSMKHESEFLDFVRIKAETLQRNANNTPYTSENDMKNMVSCNDASTTSRCLCKATMLSMGSLELLLRASVFTVLDLNEMGGTTLPREVLGAILSGLVSCGGDGGLPPAAVAAAKDPCPLPKTTTQSSLRA